MNKNRVRCGLVGAGAIAQSYARALENNESAVLAAVADVRPEAAQSLAGTVPCPAIYSHEEMAEKATVEAVIVCTPPSTHEEISTHFLQRGIPVLCEKPLSVNPASAVRMIQAAQRNKTILTMATKFRYVDDVIRAKSILSSGAIGDVLLLENVFAAPVNMAARWNSNLSLSGGGVLIDNGTHSLDLVRFLLGPLLEVQAVEGKRQQDLPVEDTVSIFVRAESGAAAKIDLSWRFGKHQDSYLDIYGSQGSISVGWKSSRYRTLSNAEWIPFGSGYDKVEAFRRQVTNFAHAIRGEEEVLITLEDALASVEVVEAAYASLHHCNWVPVEERKRSARANLQLLQSAS